MNTHAQRVGEINKLDKMFDLLSDAWGIASALNDEKHAILFKTMIDTVRAEVTAYQSAVENEGVQ